ncbi:MAG: DUF1800 family protein [Candidatus Thiodiazotropha sp. (ex Monitilora ramsayi)]|nr:DUF1800 family protein [Candidatus Thiodiazotropha sp. (ex Monitilora ramsayi)]
MSQRNYINLLIILSLMISGCGGGSSDGANSGAVDKRISGTTAKGIIHNGIVEARKIENSQRIDTILASSVTDAYGAYELALPPDQAGMFELIVRGRADAISTMVCDAPSGCGSYTTYIGVGAFSSSDIAQADLNTNGLVDFGEPHPVDASFAMKSLRVVDTASITVTAHITPLTHLIAEIAYMENRLTPSGLTAITDDIKVIYGLSSDPAVIQPIDLSDAPSAAAELNALPPEEREAALQASALFASIAEQANLNGETLVNALSVVASAAQNTLNGNPLNPQESLFNPSSLASLSNDVLAVADNGDLSAYINFAPIADADFGTTTEGGSTTIPVLDGDSDADNDNLSVTNLTTPNHGTAHLNNDGSVTYTHDGSETVSDSFTYTASDGVYESAVTTVSVAITPQNDAPIADNDSGTVSEGGSITIAVLTGDTDADGDSLSVTNLTTPSHGTVSLNSDGSVTYTHNGSNTISDSFTYTASDGVSESAVATVSISVSPQNDAPIADNDSGTVSEGGSITIAVLTGDTDADGDSLSVTNLTAPSQGTAHLNNDGSVIYTHDGSETLLDSFTYTASDGVNLSAVATVSITVLPQNDAPVADIDSGTVNEGGSVTIDILTGDSDAEGDSLSVTNLTTPNSGTVLLNSNGTVTYTHDGSETVSDSFTYTATDGSLDSNVATVNLTITPQNDHPIFSTAGVDADTPIGTAYTLIIAATDAENDLLTYTATDLPTWLSFTPQTRTLTGTPTWKELAQPFTITLSVGDGTDTIDNTFTLTVQEPSVITDQMAYRLLQQATFGPTLNEIQNLQSIGLTAWLDNQLNMASAYDSSTDDWKTHLERCIEIAITAEPATDWYGTPAFNEAVADGNADEYQMAAWWDNALGNPDLSVSVGNDQLRQRMAYALSQLLVTSHTAIPLNRRGESLAYYYDLLTKHAFGNFRTLLGEIARSPTMGVYLSHQGNKKANAVDGTRPDENFAREIVQLFTIGLYELNLDGSPNRDADSSTYPDAGGNLVPTYSQTDIEELAKVMTGWDLVANNKYGRLVNRDGDYTQQMEFTPAEHEDELEEGGDGSVTVMGNTFALNSGSDGSGMDAVIDILFTHPNIAPYVSKHLIQRFVTSNPDSDYVARVATVFNDNGNGIKGDLKSVIRAILLDPEARGDTYLTNPNYGKAKEPLLALTHFLRVANTSPLNGWTSQGGTSMANVYWLPSPEKFLGQAPMRSPSVFNFYNPDFVPSDNYFATNSLEGPEFQIQTDQMLVDFSNRLQTLVQTYEKTKIEHVDGSDPTTFAATKTHTSQNLLLTDFTPLMQLFELAMEGDSNGDFSQIKSTTTDGEGDTPKANGIDALLDRLNIVLLGDTMSVEFRAGLKHYLLLSSGTNTADNINEARLVIRDAYRMIATSSQFMIQK